jgi:hypothetical protein
MLITGVIRNSPPNPPADCRPTPGGSCFATDLRRYWERLPIIASPPRELSPSREPAQCVDTRAGAALVAISPESLNIYNYIQ